VVVVVAAVEVVVGVMWGVLRTWVLRPAEPVLQRPWAAVVGSGAQQSPCCRGQPTYAQSTWHGGAPPPPLVRFGLGAQHQTE
jgi:hypothetical protein